MRLTYIKAVRVILLASITLVLPVAAQESSDEAQEYYKHENYGSALPLLEEQLKKNPDNALLNYQAGVCYLHSRSLKARAVEYLEKAVEHSPHLRTRSNPGTTEAPADVYKMLGDAYSYAYKFDHAVKSYEQFKTFNREKDLKSPLMPEVEHKTEFCRHMKDYHPNVSLPLSAKTGSPCGETLRGTVTGSLSPDKSTMIYTMKVPVDKLKKPDESSRYFEDIPLPPLKDTISAKKAEKNPIKKLVERDTVVYASTVGTSQDGQVMLTYKNENGDGAVYISRLRDNRWSAPTRLKKCANAAGWEPYESISADGNYLYFASDRTGGYGGWDLYRCKKQPDGQWGKAVNLGPSINTEADEIAPFIYSDGLTIFFSSNRIKPGSYDIFSSTASSVSVASTWGTPVNVGYPINRNATDIFQVTADNKVFGSAPAGPAALNKADSVTRTEVPAKKVFRPDRDNYLISFTGQQKSTLNMRRGTVTDEKAEKPLEAEITLLDNLNGETQGQYHTSDKTGQFAFVLPAGRNIQVLYQAKGYLPQSENINLDSDKNYFEEYKAVKLEPLKAGATATLSNVFFAEKKTTLSGESRTELERVVALLQEHPGMEASFSCIITARDDGRFYKRLARARAKELEQYLIKKGISKKRFDVSGTRQKPGKVKEEKPEKSRTKSRKPPEPKEDKPVQVVVMEITELKEVN